VPCHTIRINFYPTGKIPDRDQHLPTCSSLQILFGNVQAPLLCYGRCPEEQVTLVQRKCRKTKILQMIPYDLSSRVVVRPNQDFPHIRFWFGTHV